MPIQSMRIDYPEIMRSLGHFIQEQHLSEVTVVEFDRGWIITGLTYQTTAHGFVRVPADFVLSHEELRKLSESLLAQRKPDQPTKRGWLG
ncbi:MAG TPA: hypothetical protein VNL77_01140 [Roseiflexaceae bacterium]|nr:hypothetical protein [Roseiflexaceae bacterium]